MKKHPLTTSIAVFIILVIILMVPFYLIGFYLKLGSYYFEDFGGLYGILVGIIAMTLAQMTYIKLKYD